MTRRARALTFLAALVVLAVGVPLVVAELTADGAASRQASPPTTVSPAAPTTLAPPTTDPPDCTATTDGRDPEVFRPRCRGPIVVEVQQPSCINHVGDGYRFRYTITNRGPTVTGYVVAQVDDKPQMFPQNSLELRAGAVFTDNGPDGQGVTYPGVAGDGLVVSLVTDDQTVSSFPAELPHCRQDPADLQDAREATTTT